jgi:hypothetical protein
MVARHLGGVGLAGMFAVASVFVPQPYKVLGWLWLSLLAAVATSRRTRCCRPRASVAGFYAFAALGLWILSLGPTVRLLGHRIWYHAPYWWFARLPGADAVRVPARLWLVVTLALAVVATHALAKLRVRRPGMARPSSSRRARSCCSKRGPPDSTSGAARPIRNARKPSDHRPLLELPLDAATN